MLTSCLRDLVISGDCNSQWEPSLKSTNTSGMGAITPWWPCTGWWSRWYTPEIIWRKMWFETNCRLYLSVWQGCAWFPPPQKKNKHVDYPTIPNLHVPALTAEAYIQNVSQDVGTTNISLFLENFGWSFRDLGHYLVLLALERFLCPASPRIAETSPANKWTSHIKSQQLHWTTFGPSSKWGSLSYRNLELAHTHMYI